MGTADRTVVEVRSQVFGAGADREEMPTVGVDLAALEAALAERVTVSELIGRVVEEQIRELLARERSEAEQRRGWAGREGGVRDILDRQYLTAGEIESGARGGVVSMPGKAAQGGASERAPEVDVGAEVEKARRAFGRGAFYVIVDGRQMMSLDEAVEYTPRTEITFLRVMPLVGG